MKTLGKILLPLIMIPSLIFSCEGKRDYGDAVGVSFSERDNEVADSRVNYSSGVVYSKMKDGQTYVHETILDAKKVSKCGSIANCPGAIITEWFSPDPNGDWIVATRNGKKGYLAGNGEWMPEPYNNPTFFKIKSYK